MGRRQREKRRGTKKKMLSLESFNLMKLCYAMHRGEEIFWCFSMLGYHSTTHVDFVLIWALLLAAAATVEVVLESKSL